MKLDRERLNRVLRPHQTRPRALVIPPVSTPAEGPPLERLVGGQVMATPYGSCLVVERRYPLDERRGPARLGDLLHLPGVAVVRLNPYPGLDALDFRSAAFIDTETTGLSGGAGTLVFMVGVGRFEGDRFVVRQFFMRRPDEERALLDRVMDAVADAAAVVTFNGRSFDLPLLTTRFRLARLEVPLADVPHFDLLTAARRVWRRRLDSCALTNLEREILRYSRAADDVPGWLIPTLYQRYLWEGDVIPMARVFYHNREDVLSMVALAAVLCRACSVPEEDDALHPIDYTALGWALEQSGDWSAAERAYRRALADYLPDDVRCYALSRLGTLLKRQGRREEAAALWQEWITSVPGDDVTPFVELAKHCEWHERDLEAALMWSQWARQIVEGWPPGYRRDVTLGELDHRISRLRRKLERG
ncbi:MAG TPA: tetratricopeptide repeat protein [Caldilineae bacterium]|nr:tetratricopeptide repeat protein [Caldilineae bacterium]